MREEIEPLPRSLRPQPHVELRGRPPHGLRLGVGDALFGARCRGSTERIRARVLDGVVQVRKSHREELVGAWLYATSSSHTVLAAQGPEEPGSVGRAQRARRRADL
eukprot:1652572-Pyramimonas_sp.AAC.1